MFLNIGNKRFVSLAALVLAPLVGFGQEIARIIEHPQNATVCVEEAATFTSETYRGIMGWRLNGTSHSQLPPEVETELIMEGMNTQNGTRWEMLSINYDEIFNGTRVQSVVVGDGSGNLANSSIAYLFYETNQQSPATGLTDTVNDTAIQIDWDASEAEVRTHYLISITDITETPDVVSSPQYVYFPESQNCRISGHPKINLTFRSTHLSLIPASQLPNSRSHHDDSSQEPYRPCQYTVLPLYGPVRTPCISLW